MVARLLPLAVVGPGDEVRVRSVRGEEGQARRLSLMKARLREAGFGVHKETEGSTITVCPGLSLMEATGSSGRERNDMPAGNAIENA